ncbi:MAG: hypothetical protein ABSH02_15115 [Candidatus Sulfotelmatobacter sp.]
MKRAFLLIVIPALLAGLGFAQTPAASINTDQTNIKGCLGGSDGSYTVVEDNTGRIFKITTSSVDLKPHLSQDVTLIGHGAGGASSAAADDSFTVTELNMISEHCAGAAAVPAATVVTPGAAATPPAETTVTPAADATAPAATVSTPAQTASTPPPAAVAPVATTSTVPETAVTPAAAATPPAETASTHAARPRRRSATRDAVLTPSAETASSSSEGGTPAAAATTPAAPASTSSATTGSTPDAAPATPAAPAKHGSLWMLISLGVLVLAISTLFPFLNRWRKRKILERTGAPNLSLTREASSVENKSDKPDVRKAA